MENNSFVAFDEHKKGLLFDDSAHPKFPVRYYNLVNGRLHESNGVEYKPDFRCSYYGYVYSGRVVLNISSRPVELTEGQFFSMSAGTFLQAEGKAVVVEVLHTLGVYPDTGFFAYPFFGGPIEKEGRLKYIDGCTDSLLIPPIKWGDPCLNHLHFPKGIVQTPHTHPSHRIGIVAKGSGECVTPFGNLPLKTGMIFIIKEWDGKTYAKGVDGKEYPIGTHSFNTYDSDMDVIAFHPDSDFGATDVNHPMINRTIVNGVPASYIDSIRTK